MKIIPKEEAGKIYLGKTGRDSQLRKNLLLLQVGEVLELEGGEWTKSSSPGYVVTYITRKLNRTFEYRKKADGTGWLFRRLS